MPNALCPGEEIVVTALPLYHVFALMVNFITYFSIGAENWLVPKPRDMAGFIETLKQARPTVLTGVNTLFAGLLMQPNIGQVDFSWLRVAIGGGAAVLPTTSAKWTRLTGKTHPRRIWSLRDLAGLDPQSDDERGILRHCRPAHAIHRYKTARRE
jgi:long-chain acyl-CoA synthetase